MERDRYSFLGLRGSATYTAGAVSDGSFTAQDITISGVVLGDWAIASFSADITDLQLNAAVTATDTVSVTFYNQTGAGVTPSGTIYIEVTKR